MNFEESKRIHNIACASYSPGRHLAATFKTYDGRHREINYFNPKDIPLSLYKWWKTWWLYSVKSK